jgi:hypothetical protein
MVKRYNWGRDHMDLHDNGEFVLLADYEAHERRVVGHVSGWQEQMDTCRCGAKWPCSQAASEAKPNATGAGSR